MKERIFKLKVFSFSHPLIQSEFISLLGDKYCNAFSFEWEFCVDLDQAHIIFWDGVISPKNRAYVEKINLVLPQKILVILGESKSLFKERLGISFFDKQGPNIIQLSSWSILPEEIMAVFEIGFKKFNHD